jgi:hypothetical protein
MSHKYTSTLDKLDFPSAIFMQQNQIKLCNTLIDFKRIKKKHFLRLIQIFRGFK